VTAPPAPGNAATGSSRVGVQAGVVQGDITIYQTEDDDPPQKRFETALALLNGGMPTRARQLLDDVVTSGYVTSEVWFYWLLAMLSGRPSSQFSAEDYTKLAANRERFPLDAGDKWASGLQTMCRLLDSMQSTDSDLRVVLKEFDALGELQKDQILRHLELFLKGPLEDEMWRRATARVRHRQMEHHRRHRVWKFFQAVPAEPRVRPLKPIVTKGGEWALVATATALFALAAGTLGRLLLLRDEIDAVLVLGVTLGAGWLCAAAGLDWRFRVDWVRAKDREYGQGRRNDSAAPAGGFAAKVDHFFDKYSRRYAPKDDEQRRAFHARTAGIRRALRDEIVEIYRESSVTAEEVSWLIRHRVQGVVRDWQAGRLWHYRQDWRVAPATKVVFVLSLVVAAAGGIATITAAMLTDALLGVGATLLAVASGAVAISGGARLVLDRRRYAATRAENESRLAGDRKALARWRKRLSDQPDDGQMSIWLDFDRKLLLDAAMSNYKLRPSDVIAHAVIEAPPTHGDYRIARVANGPWRFSRYRLLVFLLTADGIREVVVELNFSTGEFHGWQRTNYRFDAVAAVQVQEGDNGDRVFQLALVNGQTTDVKVIGSNGDDPKEKNKDLLNAALDVTGLRSTLYVLEGVAAEGKEWVRLEQRRQDSRLRTLGDAIDGNLE